MRFSMRFTKSSHIDNDLCIILVRKTPRGLADQNTASQRLKKDSKYGETNNKWGINLPVGQSLVGQHHVINELVTHWLVAR